MSDSKVSKQYPYLFLVPAVGVYFVFTVLPNLIGIFLGFTDWTVYNLFEFKFNGLDNFKQMLSERNVRNAFGNTIYFTLFTTIAKNFLGLILAVIVNQNLKTKNYLRTVVFMPLVMSPIVISVIFRALYEPENGLLNVLLRTIGLGALAREWLVDIKIAMTSVCLMEIWSGVGFCMIIFLAGLQSISKEYYESATIDGANEWQKLIYIIIPLVIQAFTVNILLSVINGLKVFGQVYALTNGGPADATQVIGTYIYKAFSQGTYGYASAIGLAFTVFVSIVSFLVVKPLRKKEVEL